MRKTLLYIWQLPQNLVGLLLVAIYKPEHMHIMGNGNKIYYSAAMHGGISLGKYSIVHTSHYRLSVNDSLKRDTVRHEAEGHAQQSRWLGWAYLLVIGLPSVIWAGLYGWLVPPSENGYYKFYTEKWADKLAGIER